MDTCECGNEATTYSFLLNKKLCVVCFDKFIVNVRKKNKRYKEWIKHENSS